MSEFNPFEENKGFERELIPEGPHLARCARVIEIGVQRSELYGDKNKAVVALAVPGVTVNINGEEKQRFISNPFGIPISSDRRSTMKQYARSLCPRGGENGNLGDFLNQPCQIVVQHENKNDRWIEKIDSIAPIIPGTPVDELDIAPFWFQWDDPDPELWPLIPPMSKRLIQEAVNYPGSKVEAMVERLEKEGGIEDDLPM